MSLLINGMDMPKNCKDCPCREYGKFSYEPDWCCLNRKNIVNAKTISPNYPLSEIPTPHGRLIDADVVCSNIDNELSGSGSKWLAEIAVHDAPTIIEAEE